MEPSKLSNGQLVARLLLQAADTVGVARDSSPPGPHQEPCRTAPCAGARGGRQPIRVMLVCGPPRSGKSTYIVETFDGGAEPVPFEIVAYRHFLSDRAYPRTMPPRRREMIALAMFQEFAEDAIRRCQQFADCGAAPQSGAREPLVVVEGPFGRRSVRLAVAAGLRAALRECDVLECRWVGYPRVVGEAVRRAGYDTFKQCAGCLQVPSAEEGFDELRVLAVPSRSIPEGLRMRVDALNMRDTVTEHNLLCRSDLRFDPHFRPEAARPTAG